MKFTFIAPALPPKLDGIGDYTASFAAELSRNNVVQLLTATPDPTPLPGIALQTVFDEATPASVRGIVAPTGEFQPDWVVVQYNPFAYGKWGWNPHLVPALRQIKRRLPHVRIATMAHETFVPIINPTFAAMAAWQRPQFYGLGRVSDIVFLSIEPWAHRFQKWFPSKPVRHLPIGSSMPRVALTREDARGRLGFDDETFVVGLFGTTHISRPLDWIGEALRRLQKIHPKTTLLYVGPHIEAIRAEMGPSIAVRAEGAASPDEVSQRFAAMDLYLAPYTDGVSTRRSAFMTGIQHGIATVSTYNFHTDSLLREQNEKALLLSSADNRDAFVANVERVFRDSDLRHRLGAAAARLYAEKFDWKQLCTQMCAYLDTVPTR